MRVFISWSGEVSMNIAVAIKEWLPAVLQAVKPYCSLDDVVKGTRWSTEVSKELEASKVGIICLVRENLQAPWIMFEAGALSKNVDKSKVCPILFGGITSSDVQGPLAQFQSAKFEKEEIRKVIGMINRELGDSGLANKVFDEVFDMWWPKLEERIETALKAVKKVSDKGERSEKDILEEVVKLTRQTAMMSERNYVELRRITDSDHKFAPRTRDVIDAEMATQIISAYLAMGAVEEEIIRRVVPLGPPSDWILRKIQELRKKD